MLTRWHIFCTPAYHLLKGFFSSNVFSIQFYGYAWRVSLRFSTGIEIVVTSMPTPWSLTPPTWKTPLEKWWQVINYDGFGKSVSKRRFHQKNLRKSLVICQPTPGFVNHQTFSDFFVKPSLQKKKVFLTFTAHSSRARHIKRLISGCSW